MLQHMVGYRRMRVVSAPSPVRRGALNLVGPTGLGTAPAREEDMASEASEALTDSGPPLT